MEQIVRPRYVSSKGRWTALFVHERGLQRKREKTWRINNFQSEWICQKPSALFTLPLSAHRAWASWPGSSGGDGVPRVNTTMHKWLPIKKKAGVGGVIFGAAEPYRRSGWYMETPAFTCRAQWAIFMLLCLGERRKNTSTVSYNEQYVLDVVN